VGSLSGFSANWLIAARFIVNRCAANGIIVDGFTLNRTGAFIFHNGFAFNRAVAFGFHDNKVLTSVVDADWLAGKSIYDHCRSNMGELVAEVDRGAVWGIRRQVQKRVVVKVVLLLPQVGPP
jgi:hypothetical protein